MDIKKIIIINPQTGSHRVIRSYHLRAQKSESAHCEPEKSRGYPRFCSWLRLSQGRSLHEQERLFRACEIAQLETPLFFQKRHSLEDLSSSNPSHLGLLHEVLSTQHSALSTPRKQHQKAHQRHGFIKKFHSRISCPLLDSKSYLRMPYRPCAPQKSQHLLISEEKFLDIRGWVSSNKVPLFPVAGWA